VLNFNIAPSILQILSNKAPVAIVGFLFAAQQAPAVEQLSRSCFFNVPHPHQLEKLPLI
jgi:hypothetical protein